MARIDWYLNEDNEDNSAIYVDGARKFVMRRSSDIKFALRSLEGTMVSSVHYHTTDLPRSSDDDDVSEWPEFLPPKREVKTRLCLHLCDLEGGSLEVMSIAETEQQVREYAENNVGYLDRISEAFRSITIVTDEKGKFLRAE